MHDLLGLQTTPETISTLHILVRTVLVFFVTVAYVRLSGMRTFGSKTAFDTVIYIMLGAILSRAIVAASPFFPTLLAGLTLVILHRIMAHATLFNEKLGNLIKGKQRMLVKDGKIIWKNMKRSNISELDLLGGIRKKGFSAVTEVKKAYIERNGEISVLPMAENKDTQQA